MMPSTTAGVNIGTREIPRGLDKLPETSHHEDLENSVRVRRYTERDRCAIRQLCCETGFLGNPIDPVFEDRQLFADLFTGAYLNHEPEWAFVAEAQHGLVGYLLGSIRKDFELLLMRNGFPIASKMLGKVLTGKYVRGRSKRFVRWLLTTAYAQQPKHPPNAAHLHLDLAGAYRGRGVARRLWQAYERRLRLAGIDQCYGSFFSHPRRRPELIYARYGFSLYDRKRTTIFEPEVGDVEVVCVTRNLTAAPGRST